MSDLSRREIIVGAGATAIAISAPIPIAMASAPEPAWAVGMPGEWNWIATTARSEHLAKIEWVVQYIGGDDRCDVTGGELGSDPDCECEGCEAYAGLDADRQPSWDGHEVKGGGALWCNAGLGANCSRCSYETCLDEGGRVIGDAIVCSECLTLADWDALDPVYAAELRAEIEDCATPALISNQTDAKGGGG